MNAVRCEARWERVRCARDIGHDGPHQSHRDRDRAAVLWCDSAPGATRQPTTHHHACADAPAARSTR